MWKKYGATRQVTDDNILGYMRFTCWVNRAADTLLGYVRVSAFPRLRERASELRYARTYIACLVVYDLDEICTSEV